MYDSHAACHARADTHEDSANHAERLAALAQEARLLAFGVEGDSEVARGVAVEMEGALTGAMDADSAAELTAARNEIDAVLARVAALGLRFSAQLTDMECDGVLGRTKMPVLSAVLSG